MARLKLVMQTWVQSKEECARPLRQPGSMKGLIKIQPGFDEGDKEIEALFYGVSIEPPTRCEALE